MHLHNSKEIFDREATLFNHCESMYKHANGFEGYWQNRRKSRILKQLQSLKDSCITLLDVGCAEGYYLEAAQSLGYEVTGTDISSKKLEKIKDFPTVTASAESLPFDSGTFDVVMMNRVIEYVNDREAAIREAFRVAKKWVIITVPFGKTPYRYQWGLIANPYTASELRKSVEKYGQISALELLCPLGQLPKFGRFFRKLNPELLYRLDRPFEKVFHFAGTDLFLSAQPIDKK